MSEPSQPPRRKVVINQKVMPGPAVSYDPVVSSHLQKIFNLVMMFKQKKQPDPVLINNLSQASKIVPQLRKIRLLRTSLT